MDQAGHTSLSLIRRWFAPSFVSYIKGPTRVAAASDKAYQLLAHGRWFSSGTPASSTNKTCRHIIAEILVKVALNTKNQNQNQIFFVHCCLARVWSALLRYTTSDHENLKYFLLFVCSCGSLSCLIAA